MKPRRPRTKGPPAPKVVYAVEATQSAKVGKVSATYVSQRTCPTSCAFLAGGCYAMNGHMSLIATKPLNRNTPADMTAAQIARIEARAIDTLSGRLDLRLHIVGDSFTETGTINIATAAEAFMRRGGRRVWTYTHAWREVPREAWGEVSVLASCETEAEVLEARARGYAAALVVESHGTPKRHAQGPLQVLPCPEQTRGVQCVSCRLCMDDRRLLATGTVIAFAVHGSPVSKSKAAAVISRKQGVLPSAQRNRAAQVEARAGLRKCSVGWCNDPRARWCPTCARPFCADHLCDDHEVRQVAYSIPANAAGMKERIA